MILSNTARIPWLASLLIATGLLNLAGTATAADSATAVETYTWSARLVALDTGARTVTVESLLVSDESRAEAAGLHAGDHATLTWSGITSAAGVRSVTRGPASEDAALTLPIEFVSTELDGRYVRFKVRVPASDLAAIESLGSGEWITAVSPQHAMAPERAVISIRPYNSVSTS